MKRLPSRARILGKVLVLMLIPLAGFVAEKAVGGERIAGISALLGVVVLLIAVLWTKAQLQAFHREGLAREQLAPLSPRAVVPWSEYALSPEVLAQVLVDTQCVDTPTVVECGSGISTLYLGQLVRNLGSGRVVTIEHDAQWAAKMNRLVRASGLEEFVHLLHVPLADEESGGRTAAWYDRTILSSSLSEGLVIDVLLIDGPTCDCGPLCRAPALPFFSRYLRSGARVILDDADRRGERRILDEWLWNYRLRLTLERTVGEAAFLRWTEEEDSRSRDLPRET